MTRKRPTLDQTPGKLPEIRSVGDSMTFALTVSKDLQPVRLMIRCDADGNVWASIQPAAAD